MSDIPEHLLRRSAEAKAKALGIPVEQVLAEMTGETPPTSMAAGEQPKVETVGAAPEASSDSAPAASAPAETAPQPDPDPAPEEPAPVAAATSDTDGDIDYEAAAAKAGMPASLLQRSVEAKAKASGASAAQVLAEMLGEEAPAPAAAAPAAAPAASADPEPVAPEVVTSDEAAAEAVAEVVDMPAPGQQSAPAASAPAAPPSGGGATAVAARPIAQPEAVPEGVRTQRLLTVVKAKAIQQVKSEPSDKVSTWPHLMIMEFAVLLAVTGFLVILSVILQAPLLESANFNATPNPSKAPWYFLGLQELLSYFDPQVAGVGVPLIIGLIGFMSIPYVDRNPSNKPSDRKFAIFMYTFFLMGASTLTILGVFFRGPGFNFTYPWADGIFFDDLKDWVNFE